MRVRVTGLNVNGNWLRRVPPGSLRDRQGRLVDSSHPCSLAEIADRVVTSKLITYEGSNPIAAAEVRGA
jgi:hypothetical protein